MKKLLLIAIVMLSVFAANAASYRVNICGMRGTTDTTVITLEQRLDQCIKVNCFKILRGHITKASIDQNAQFTDQILKEFALRGVRGNMLQLLAPGFQKATDVDGHENTVTDAQLDAAFLYLVWPIAVLIGNGSL